MNDSTAETLAHIRRVNTLLLHFVNHLLHRAMIHDESKLHGVEKQFLDSQVGALKDLKYSETYLDEIQESERAPSLEEFLKAHYSKNSHHPQFYDNGVNDMTLVDLIEMAADWKAAGERHDTGSFENSLEVNIKRFELSDQLRQILENTGVMMGWI